MIKFAIKKILSYSFSIKKISHYIKIDSDEIKPAQYSSGTVNQWRRQETEKMMKKMNASELNIFLDQNGERQTSKGLAQWFEKQMSLGISRVNFFMAQLKCRVWVAQLLS